MTFNKELSNSLSLISLAERDLNFSGGRISRLLSFSGGLLTCSMTLESSRKEKGLIQSIITPKHPIKIFPMPLSGKAQSDLHLSLQIFHKDRKYWKQHILPKCITSKRLRYEKQTKVQNPFRLLLVEVSHGGKVLENEEEGVLRKWGQRLYLLQSDSR